jgi:hypothetical protein
MEDQMLADDSATLNAGAQEGDQAAQTVEQLKAELDAVKQQNAKYSVALHTFTKRLDKFENAARAIPDIEEHLTANGSKAKAPEKSDAEKRLQLMNAELESLKSDIANERKEKKALKIGGEVKRAFDSLGIDSEASATLTDFILAKHADKFDDVAEVGVVVDGTETVDAYVKRFVETNPLGKSLIQPKRTTRNNSAAMSTGSASGKQKISLAEYGKLSLAEIKSGNFEISD